MAKAVADTNSDSNQGGFTTVRDNLLFPFQPLKIKNRETRSIASVYAHILAFRTDLISLVSQACMILVQEARHHWETFLSSHTQAALEMM